MFTILWSEQEKFLFRPGGATFFSAIQQNKSFKS